MGAAFIKQPNGLYCRFSTIVDSPTHWNMTKEEIKELLMKKAEEDIDKRIADLDKHPEWGWSFKDVLSHTFLENGNISKEDFERFKKDCNEPV